MRTIFICLITLLLISSRSYSALSNPDTVVGVYSNKAKSLTVVLGRNGSGQITSSRSRTITRIRYWGYSSDDKTISIESRFEKNHKLHTVLFHYDDSTNAFKSKDPIFKHELRKMTDKEQLQRSALKHYDYVPDKAALQEAKNYVKQMKYQLDKVIIASINLKDPKILELTKLRSKATEKYRAEPFTIKPNDEMFNVTTSRLPRQVLTIQLRKNSGKWEIIYKRRTRYVPRSQ